MNTLRSEMRVGRKNILFGAFLFLLFAVCMGIPLTINLFGGSALSAEQYELWKVVHAYGLFLGVINVFLGTSINNLQLSRGQKELLSWSFIIAALFGAIVRMALVLLAVYDTWHLVPSFGEAVFFSIGLALFVYGLSRAGDQIETTTPRMPSAEDRPVRTKA